MSERRTELLEAAAEALESGDDPFSGRWLGEHDVTSDECVALASQMAIGCRVVAAGLSKPRSGAGLAVMEALAGAL